MTRAERSEFTYIKNTIKRLAMDYGTTLTIRTNASTEYKRALDALYTSLNFHPASIRVDTQWYDENERIIYIFGRTFEFNGEQRSWTELYTAEERERFEAALN